MRAIVLLAAAGLAACSTLNPPPPPAPRATAAPPATPSPTQTEAQASTRDSSATRGQIKAVQGRLAREGFYDGPVDGVWGSATADALGKYQAAHNLAVTGKLNTETLDSFSP